MPMGRVKSSSRSFKSYYRNGVIVSLIIGVIFVLLFRANEFVWRSFASNIVRDCVIMSFIVTIL